MAEEQRGVTWAAGVAALALVALLVYAVVRTSSSSHAPGFAPPASPQDTTSASAYTTASTSTSYTVPSVRTSDLNPGPAPATTTAEGPASEGSEAPSTSTTIYNSYGTTTPTNAGHV